MISARLHLYPDVSVSSSLRWVLVRPIVPLQKGQQSCYRMDAHVYTWSTDTGLLSDVQSTECFSPWQRPLQDVEIAGYWFRTVDMKHHIGIRHMLSWKCLHPLALLAHCAGSCPANSSWTSQQFQHQALIGRKSKSVKPACEACSVHSLLLCVLQKAAAWANTLHSVTWHVCIVHGCLMQRKSTERCKTLRNCQCLHAWSSHLKGLLKSLTKFMQIIT